MSEAGGYFLCSDSVIAKNGSFCTRVNQINDTLMIVLMAALVTTSNGCGVSEWRGKAERLC